MIVDKTIRSVTASSRVHWVCILVGSKIFVIYLSFTITLNMFMVPLFVICSIVICLSPLKVLCQKLYEVSLVSLIDRVSTNAATSLSDYVAEVYQKR